MNKIFSRKWFGRTNFEARQQYINSITFATIVALLLISQLISTLHNLHIK